MFRKIVAAVLCTLIFMGVLAAGNLTIQTFAQKIELKNPFHVFGPLAERLGIHFDIDFEQDTGGSFLVNADNDKNDSSSNNTDIDLPELNIPEIDIPEIDLPEIILSLPNYNNPNAITSDTPVITTKEELDELVSKILVVDEKNLRTNYDRNLFESPIKSYELNGKKYNRHDYALLTSPYLISEDPFKYECPYTGLLITDKSKVDYDHIIPLSMIYKLTDWDAEKCNEYAYAQNVGVGVNYSANRSKGDKGPSEWVPNKNTEDYCYTWLVIAEEWEIPLLKRDIDVSYLYCLNAINSGNALERID